MRSRHYREAAKRLADWQPEDPLGDDFYTGVGVAHAASLLEKWAGEVEMKEKRVSSKRAAEQKAQEGAAKEAADVLGKMRKELILQGYTPDQAYELVKLALGTSVTFR
ncbi:hypothetical protein ACPCAA_17625 [Streptomyces griseoincarnatus]